MSDKTLDERVMDFRLLQLPGQPMAMHMGTSYLVTDLHNEVKRLQAERDALRELLKEWLRVPCSTPEGSSLYPHYADLRKRTETALREGK
jgi:hypothetical protein